MLWMAAGHSDTGGFWLDRGVVVEGGSARYDLVSRR
jgi:hypothetical protein